jgi:hypothetical protein
VTAVGYNRFVSGIFSGIFAEIVIFVAGTIVVLEILNLNILLDKN